MQQLWNETRLISLLGQVFEILLRVEKRERVDERDIDIWVFFLS